MIRLPALRVDFGYTNFLVWFTIRVGREKCRHIVISAGVSEGGSCMGIAALHLL